MLSNITHSHAFGHKETIINMNSAVDDIHVALSDMTAQVTSQAPKLRPSVFPSYIPVKSIFDLCVSKTQRESVRKWLSEKDVSDDEAVFETTIDYPCRRVVISGVKIVDSIDAVLYSLEKVMQENVTGSASDFSISSERFLSANGYDSENVAANLHIVSEVYNMSYAMKVLISNVGGFTAYVGKNQLPLSVDDDIVEILESVFKIAGDGDHLSEGERIGGSAVRMNDEGESDESEEEVETSAKKRKHRRGKKK